MSFIDQGDDPGPPHVRAIVLGLLASPLSIAAVFAVLSWPFALGFAALALPLCIVVGIPTALVLRARIYLTFSHCMLVGGFAGFAMGCGGMVAAAISDWNYDIRLSFCILVLGGVICGGIAYPWISWIDGRLSITGLQ